MLFERTEEQEMLTDTLTRFVVDVVKPHATAWSQAGKMPAEALEGLRDLGVLAPLNGFRRSNHLQRAMAVLHCRWWYTPWRFPL